MDIGYIITGGLAAVVTGIPIYLAARNQGISSVLELVPDLGKTQKDFHRTTSSDIVSLIKVQPGAHIRTITTDFREYKEEEWFNFIEGLLNKQISITVYGGPKIKARNEIGDLVAKGLNVRLIGNPTYNHFMMIDEPKQLWFEGRHRISAAYNCVYTNQPHERVWDDITDYFKELDNKTKQYSH